ncbi:DUF4233 domain-containing protein [Demequina globuliformis]|uniref:DUF4233 domain-containing protein n=1 Tax=Demequina globuliformis TaxID=676202 RepID=UPI000781A0BD|nr:DUF4233 domain-containing protein [Demequina globuliformis]
MTDAQNPAPQPPAKKQRSALLIFCQATLLLEAFCALFATLLLWGLARGGMIDIPLPWLLGGGLVVVVLMAWASGQQAKSWGRPLGWAMQLPLLLGGFLDTAITIIGVVFLIVWIMGVRLGTRIDRERAERDEAAAAATPAGGDAQ